MPIVVFLQRSTLSIVLLLSCVIPLASCSSSPLGQQLQDSLEADPRLTGQTPSSTASPTPNSNPAALTQLAASFPAEIPRYPNSTLQEVIPNATDPANPTATQELRTRWSSPDPSDRILSFYLQTLPANSWQILAQPTDTSQGSIIARKNNLRLTVTVQPTATQSDLAGNAQRRTEFVVQYAREGSQAASSSPTPAATQPTETLAQLRAFPTSTSVGAAGSSDSTQAAIILAPNSFTDLDKTPSELQKYVADLAKLGVLTPATSNNKSNPAKDSSRFEPNKAVTRREFARWLIATNNRLYRDRPVQQIRLAPPSTQSAFQDISPSDPDFAAIQGLAEAGILPSPLSGDSTTVVFKPNQPLTRDNALLWKVPMDTQQALPIATIEAVQQTWGFQDTAKIAPKALRAVLVDFQNGDLSNIRRAFGYTTLFQPKKPVTRAEAAAMLWYFGFQGEGQSAQDALQTSAPKSTQ